MIALLASLAALGMALLSVQDPPAEWDVVEQADGRDLSAVAAFSNDLIIIARCNLGVYEASLQGLPLDQGEFGLRSLRVAIDEPGSTFEPWHATSDGMGAFSRLPAAFARRLRQGGQLNVTVPARAGQPAQRFILDLPSSAAAIDRTLSACDQPLADSRDADLVDDLRPAVQSSRSWARRPSVRYPPAALQANAMQGAVTISCLARADGRLDACQVESEYPGAVGFGVEALKAASNARLEPAPGSHPRIIALSVMFRTEQRR